MIPVVQKSKHTVLQFLPLRDEHVVPLDDLDPEAVRVAVRQELIRNPDRPDGIRHAAALSAVAKLLGFRGGFDGYQKQWPSLCTFMREHGLLHRKNLLAPPPEAWAVLTLRRQYLAERIFNSGRPLPERIFTGHDLDWAPLDQHSHPPMSGPMEARYALPVVDPTEVAPFLARHLHTHVFAGFNLLHDGLVHPRADDRLVAATCFNPTTPPEEVKEIQREDSESFRLFQQWIDRDRRGWVELIRYNRSLVFLRAPDGAYDFVFRGLRDRPPPAAPFDGNLSPRDIPDVLSTHARFERWRYFQVERWSESDEWEAETAYYTAGGDSLRYPGTLEVVRRWSVAQGSYQAPTLPVDRTALDGFVPVAVDGARSLFVSPLVTIAALRRFLAETDYEKRRAEKVDDLAAPNHDPDELPACVNWYDAQAYARWFEQKHHRPVRLLRCAEYLQLHPGALPAGALPRQAPGTDPMQARLTNGCVDFIKPDGTRRTEWAFIGGDEQARFRPGLSWREGAGGLRFIAAIGFGEWLFEHNETSAAAVSTASLQGIHDGLPVARDFFPSSSWGKYRACKIGFRLCYEADDTTTQGVAR